MGNENFTLLHKRNASDLSTISVLDESTVTSTELPEDHGYGSVKSTVSNGAQEKSEDIDWKYEGAGDSHTASTTSNGDSEGKVDVGLVLKLQHKLSDVEREKSRLQNRLDDLDMSPRTEKAQNAARDAARISELELEIERLRDDNDRQRRILATNLTTAPQSQSEAFMQHEITRLTTENLELHDKNDLLNETIRKLKRQVKLMARKLKLEHAEIPGINGTKPSGLKGRINIFLEAKSGAPKGHRNLPPLSYRI